MYGGEASCPAGFWWGNLRERNHLENRQEESIEINL
jgi:hypothetical protein